jgi:hypothetical protein
MKRLKVFLSALLCISAIAATTAAVAQADPSNGGGPYEGTLTYHFFDCTGPAGTPSSFAAVRQAAGDAWLLTNGTGIYVIQGVVDETTATTYHFPPGLSQSGKPTVTCTEIGPITGHTFLTVGFFTPAG